MPNKSFFLKLLIRLTLIVFLGIVLLGIAIQFPSVQTFVAKKISHQLAQQLDTKIEIGAVDIDFFKTLVLDNIYIEDQQGDTLVYAERLAGDIALFSLFEKKIHLQSIELLNANINLQQKAQDSTFNYSFLLALFGEEKEESTSSSTWDFSLQAIQLQACRFAYIDDLQKQTFRGQIAQFETVFSTFNLIDKIIAIKNATLNNSTFEIRLPASNPDLAIPKTSPKTSTTPLQFPNMGWTIALDNFSSKDNFVRYKKGAKATVAAQKQLNAQDLTIKNIILEISDVIWKTDFVGANLKHFSFLEKSGFKIEDFGVNFSMQPKAISLQNLQLKTPFSKIKNSSSIQFPAFEQLNNWKALRLNADFQQTLIDYRDLRILAPIIGDIPYLNTDINEKIHLTTQLKGNFEQLRASNLKLAIGQKELLQATANIKTPLPLENLSFDLLIQQCQIAYDDAVKWTKNIDIPLGFQDWGTVKIAGSANGKINAIQLQELIVQTEVQTGLQAKGTIQNVLDSKQLAFDVAVNRLYTRAADLKNFELPPLAILDSLGLLNYSGNIQGNLYEFALKGTTTSAAGTIEKDVLLRFNDDYSTADYEGNIVFDNIQMPTLLPDVAGLGILNARLEGKGGGISLDRLNAQATLAIQRFDYQKYRYENIDFTAQIADQILALSGQLDDPNARLNFDGAADFNPKETRYTLDLKIDSIRTKALQLSEENFAFSTQLQASIEGDSLNSLGAAIQIGDLHLSKDSLDYYTNDIQLTVDQSNTASKEISLLSPFLDLAVLGKYKLDELPLALKIYATNILPTLNADSSMVSSQDFDFSIDLKAAKPLFLFDNALKQLSPFQLEGHFDNVVIQNVELNGFIKTLAYAENKFKNINLQSNQEAAYLVNKISADSVLIGNFFLPKASFDLRFGEEDWLIASNIKGVDNQQLLKMSGTLNFPPKTYRFQFDEQFVLNDTLWQINANNTIIYEDKKLLIRDLNFANANKSLQINSQLPATKKMPPIAAVFKEFDVGNVMQLLSTPQIVDGTLTGKCVLYDPFEQLHYTAAMKIPNLSLNKEKIGALELDVAQAKLEEEITFALDLNGAKNQLQSNGTYSVKSNLLNLQTNITTLDMRLLDPFLVGIISESAGAIKGAFSVNGPPQKLDLKGQLTLDNVSTLIGFTNTRYLIKDQIIGLTSNEIRIDNMQLLGDKNQVAQLDGFIKHQFFSNFELDMKMSTEQFQFLNTSAKDNPLFYGNLLLKASATIKGLASNPKIAIAAKTLPSSNFSLSPFAGNETIASDDYIIMGNPNTIKKEVFQDNYELKHSFPFDIQLNLELTDDISFNFIVDPLSGDKLICRGNSNLVLNLRPSGAIEMYGNYRVKSGQYAFSYGQFIKRNFEIQQGSTVLFNGDPLNARFDITANYSTAATPYELIKNETSLNNEETEAAKKRQLTLVLLSINGTIAKPELSFDIALPNLENVAINSSIDRKLASLRTNANELNRQVFGLLLANSFISANNNPNLVNSSESAVLSSLSSLFSKQLNQLADKYISGVELNVDINSYKSQYATAGTSGMTTEVGVGLSKKLFNDRLTIKAGGNIDLNANASDFSAISGDFLLQYKLNEKGNYILTVFRKSKFDVINESNNTRNGISISAKKSF